MPFDVPSYLLGKQSGGGGGGGSVWTKLAEQDFEVSTTSTSSTKIGTISCGSAAYTADKILFVTARDKAGPRNGYCYGADAIIVNAYAANPSQSSYAVYNQQVYITYYLNNGTQWNSSRNQGGVYPINLSASGDLDIYAKYQAQNVGTIDGTYHVEVYTLEWPDNVSPFA